MVSHLVAANSRAKESVDSYRLHSALERNASPPWRVPIAAAIIIVAPARVRTILAVVAILKVSPTKSIGVGYDSQILANL